MQALTFVGRKTLEWQEPPAMAAGASDNIADGYRTVAPALAAALGEPVLVAGDGSIALYAGWWAKARSP